MSTILSIDDEANILELRHMLLEQAGYNVLDAKGGIEALRIFAAIRVDLILLDYLMPEMDGEAVAKEMKRKRPHVPIIIISASLDCLDRMRGKVDSVIPKGDRPELLLAEITRFLSVDNKGKPMPTQYRVA